MAPQLEEGPREPRPSPCEDVSWLDLSYESLKHPTPAAVEFLCAMTCHEWQMLSALQQRSSTSDFYSLSAPSSVLIPEPVWGSGAI